MVAVDGHLNGIDPSTPPASLTSATGTQWTLEKIKELFAALELPFAPAAIRWRVTNTSKNGSRLRGQILPYADQRAYLDRLNSLVSPNGWTRKYEIHTSANFERSKDQKITAKVIVSCEVTIFGIGSHGATGEEWADNDNAATSAEAQAFKRGCACFGLGRYLYYFRGAWVDLDERKQPRSLPRLPEWATPEGWLKGLRPETDSANKSSNGLAGTDRSNSKPVQNGRSANVEIAPMVREIGAMQERLGNKMYRGLLKKVARVWSPTEIQDRAMLERLLNHMEAAGRGFRRVEELVSELGRGPLIAVLNSFNVISLEQIADLDTLKRIVVALEAKAHPVAK